MTKETKASLHPLRYGDGNVVEAFQSKLMGIEVVISDGTSVYKNVLTLEEALSLKSKIEESIESYWDFQGLK